MLYLEKLFNQIDHSLPIIKQNQIFILEKKKNWHVDHQKLLKIIFFFEILNKYFEF